MKILTIPTLMLALLLGCSQESKKESKKKAPNYAKLADDLAHKFIIIDGHIDLPYKLKGEGYMANGEIPDMSGKIDGNFDFKKASSGGLDAPFMSIYLPSRLQNKPGDSKALADSLIDMVGQIANLFPNHFAMARSPEDVQKNFKNGLVSLPMGMENGSGLEDDLANVKYFFDRGIRYVTLTHAKDNLICDSSYDTTRTWNGLSEYGRQVVQEMNRQGIMVDISHVSDSAFYQVMELTKSPCIASHSSVRKFTPGFERNMSDEMIRELAQNGGVIQINFGSTFLLEKSKAKWDELKTVKENYKEQNPDVPDSVLSAFANNWMLENDFYADVEDAADHIDHVVKLVGIDYVGFGSDFDGVGNSLPTGLKTSADYPNLIAVLLERGYSEEAIEKICYKNVFRVWNAVLGNAGK